MDSLTLPPLPEGLLTRAAIRARLKLIADLERSQRRAAGRGAVIAA